MSLGLSAQPSSVLERCCRERYLRLVGSTADPWLLAGTVHAGMLSSRDRADLQGSNAPGLNVKQLIGPGHQVVATTTAVPQQPAAEAPAASEQHSNAGKLKYAAVYSALDEGEGYDAYLPGGPCVIGAGCDLASTKQNLREGLQLWIEDALKSGIRVPESDALLDPYHKDQGPEVVKVDWVEVDIPGCT